MCQSGECDCPLNERGNRYTGEGSTVDIKQASKDMQSHLDHAKKELLNLLVDPVRRDAVAMTNFVTYSQRLKDKLVNYASKRS